ncbi:MAG: hypothetical protein DRQ02_02650 [Candidatus Latescibacterota bacterium]|nr:MAG: hypothetical protein DRQ02_02650 [Candidatus Latescibacterota bacterium]
MSSYPENTSIAFVFQASDTLIPSMSFYSFMSVVQVLTEGEASISPYCAETKAIGYQSAVRYFMEKTTKDYLVFLDMNVTPPTAGIQYLVQQFAREKKCGVMCALTFWAPRALPSLYTKVGVERMGGYSFTQYAPMMSTVGKYVVQHQDAVQWGTPLLTMPAELIDVETFNGGLFVISREVLKRMDELVFHERKGNAMGTFTKKVRTLGFTVKAALNIICAAGGVNHVDFLSLYGKEKE